MLLPHSRETIVWSIYIPLCLYLYYSLCTSCCCGFYIYIPLCLYLYEKIKHCVSTGFLFTFHYVYIYIKSIITAERSDINLHSTMFIFISGTAGIFLASKSFTFHYVYIYIKKAITYYASAMLIYIPLCLYLYFLRDIDISINLIYLHSTMFIFICCQATSSCVPYLHLHSTMFIFISTRKKPEINKFFHLHSTMFIFI